MHNIVGGNKSKVENHENVLKAIVLMWNRSEFVWRLFHFKIVHPQMHIVQIEWGMNWSIALATNVFFPEDLRYSWLDFKGKLVNESILQVEQNREKNLKIFHWKIQLKGHTHQIKSIVLRNSYSSSLLI